MSESRETRDLVIGARVTPNEYSVIAAIATLTRTTASNVAREILVIGGRAKLRELAGAQNSNGDGSSQ